LSNSSIFFGKFSSTWKSSKVQGIINAIKELETAITDYRKLSYGANKEEIEEDSQSDNESSITSETNLTEVKEKIKQIKEENKKLEEQKNELETQLKEVETNYQQIKNKIVERRSDLLLLKERKDGDEELPKLIKTLEEEISKLEKDLSEAEKKITRTNFLLLENRVKNLINMSWSDKINQGWTATYNGAKYCASKTWNCLTAPAWYWDQWNKRKDNKENKELDNQQGLTEEYKENISESKLDEVSHEVIKVEEDIDEYFAKKDKFEQEQVETIAQQETPPK